MVPKMLTRTTVSQYKPVLAVPVCAQLEGQSNAERDGRAGHGDRRGDGVGEEVRGGFAHSCRQHLDHPEQGRHFGHLDREAGRADQDADQAERGDQRLRVEERRAQRCRGHLSPFIRGLLSGVAPPAGPKTYML
jgi:hypothetical protein